jgi:hypothetical protein
VQPILPRRCLRVFPAGVEASLERLARMPDRLPEDTAKAGQTRPVGKLHDATVQVSVGQLTAPGMLVEHLRIAVMVARDPPDSVDDGRQLDFEWAFRFHVPQEDDGRRIHEQRRVADGAEHAMRVAAIEDGTKGSGGRRCSLHGFLMVFVTP